ncbi:Mitochondrial import receptor subunit tom70 [Trametes pubescens]|uniref:Mitochondrial import receptor subunit tom70 n=1 Tax=Trametes pubescens TaxID=154538 RepID=A0A1M2VT78_TRAPU|nr:Mitochondrial import receptor subunit tom70 [Trametes pubescens]
MSSSTSSQGVVDRVQNFVSEHKHAVLIGTAAALVAIGGAAYYASSSSGPRGDVEKGEGKKDRKKGKKRKTVKDDDGPILEERKSKVSAVEEGASRAYVEARIAAHGNAEEPNYTAEEIAVLPEEERVKAAASLKAKGNSAYQQRKFSTAIDYYTRAIAVTPKPEPVFFSNRAACFVNLNPPQHEKVIEDCDQALALDKNYLKALNRRATALEALGRFEDALRDFTAAAILDKFQNMSAAESVERVLKKLATDKAAEIYATREPRLPSHMFTSAYFGAFRPRPVIDLPENHTTGDSTLRMALEALRAADYAHAFTLVNESIEQGISWDAGKAEALNLRGTFKFLMTDIEGAKADFLQSIELAPSFTQTWVKIASVYMEQGDPKKAFECFEDAIKHNPNDPDIYYHRGQVLFIMNEFAEAAENYTKSTELDNQFVFSHIQLAVAQYKSGNLANSMATFRRTLTAFPTRSEPQNYYGELLLDQQRYPEAIQKFDSAIEIERAKASSSSSPMNVLPMVNKGLAIFQSEQNVEAAEKCCQEALDIDSECEAAVATLAQLSLQQGKIDVALKMFDRQASLARSEPELISALTYQFATQAQVKFMESYPEMAAQLGQMARMM